MTYLKLNDTDFSMYVNKLQVATKVNYKGRTNASGNTLVKYVNKKYVLDVGIIPLDADVMQTLQTILNGFTLNVSFLEPATKELKQIRCMISSQIVDYYTIQDSDVRFKAFSLVFNEL